MGKSFRGLEGDQQFYLFQWVECSMREPFGNRAGGDERQCNLQIFLPITKVLSILEAIISKFCPAGHDSFTMQWWGKLK